MEAKTTILLAEDHPVIREVTEQILRRLGYDVDSVRNGREVLTAIQAKKYPLILMDLRMPELDGVETARIIMETTPAEERPHIVALTADVTRERQRQCLAVGMAAFITKPIDRARLKEVVEQLVDKCGVAVFDKFDDDGCDLEIDGEAVPTTEPS